MNCLDFIDGSRTWLNGRGPPPLPPDPECDCGAGSGRGPRARP